MNKKSNEVLAEIKRIGWSAIQLTSKSYRGAAQTYKTSKGSIVPIMFYLDEAFIVEDKDGLFGVQDLVAGLMKVKSIDLEATGCIQGLSLVAYEEEGEVYYVDKVLDRLDINAEAVKSDLKRRLLAVSQLKEMEEVPM